MTTLEAIAVTVKHTWTVVSDLLPTLGKFLQTAYIWDNGNFEPTWNKGGGKWPLISLAALILPFGKASPILVFDKHFCQCNEILSPCLLTI